MPPPLKRLTWPSFVVYESFSGAERVPPLIKGLTWPLLGAGAHAARPPAERAASAAAAALPAARMMCPGAVKLVVSTSTSRDAPTHTHVFFVVSAKACRGLIYPMIWLHY